jgi:hypothetical protein
MNVSSKIYDSCSQPCDSNVVKAVKLLAVITTYPLLLPITAIVKFASFFIGGQTSHAITTWLVGLLKLEFLRRTVVAPTVFNENAHLMERSSVECGEDFIIAQDGMKSNQSTNPKEIPPETTTEEADKAAPFVPTEQHRKEWMPENSSEEGESIRYETLIRTDGNRVIKETHIQATQSSPQNAPSAKKFKLLKNLAADQDLPFKLRKILSTPGSDAFANGSRQSQNFSVPIR